MSVDTNLIETENHDGRNITNDSKCAPNNEWNESNVQDIYQYLVLDSGPIIKRFYSSSSTGLSSSTTTTMTRIWEKAHFVYTVPAVINEIRDANARQYLQSLPFDIILQEPKSTTVQQIIAFAKLTGDYHSLSFTDIQVLALLYDLEVIGCHGSISHIRTTPKRKLGLGKIQTLNSPVNNSNNTEQNTGSNQHTGDQPNDENGTVKGDTSHKSVNKTNRTLILEDYDVENEYEGDEDEPNVGLASTNDNHAIDDPTITDEVARTAVSQPPKSWASLVRPVTSTSSSAPANMTSATVHVTRSTTSFLLDAETAKSPQSLSYNKIVSDIDGQFSDASEDGDEIDWTDDDDDNHETNGDAEHRQSISHLEHELRSDFPSLAASLLVPYDDEIQGNQVTFIKESSADSATIDTTATTASEKRKLQSLQPLTKSGKLYNSFSRYKYLMKPKSVKTNPTEQVKQLSPPLTTATATPDNDTDFNRIPNYSSRIVGSGGNTGDMGDDFEDDGEGWIMTPTDITKLKAAGVLDPSRTVKDINNIPPSASSKNSNVEPALCHRAACVTTDFAMQNVILQMNLELLSLDGIRVRKLKNWVTRCGACYTVYTNTDTNNVVGPLGKRLFCEKCGSDLMQRIAASVDGKTGRLRLHLSKKYQYNLRGTKFSLPKPGTGNRFQGDLLLREDQLLMGAWNQKLKMISGGKARDAAQSIFGRDIATNVGCHANSVNMDDIRVGFGRRNPNAVKGRERRGKKKKSVNTACGLRRY